MANPAQLLLAVLQGWNQPTKTAEDARNPVADDWAIHRQAVRHLDAIDQLLTEAAASRNVSVYRQYFPSWASAVFAYPTGWSRGNSGQIDRRSLEHLENLSEFLRSYVPELAPTGEAQLREYVKNVRNTLESDTTVPADLRIHLRTVIAHVLHCLDQYEVYGAFELQRAVEHLASSVLRTASNSEDIGKWDTAVKGFVWPFAINVMAAIPSQALAQFALGSGD